MQGVWDRFHRWIAANAPQVLESLPPGATDDEIRQTEETLGVTLPEDFKASYRIHNGQGQCGLLGYLWNFNSLEQARNYWHDWMYNAGADEEPEGSTDRAVRNDWWNPRWVPFGSDDEGNHYCLDLDPGGAGKVGQVFHFTFYAQDYEVVAESYRAWLTDIVERCESGGRRYSDSYGGLLDAEDF